MGERLFAITDAVTETHEGYYQHTLEGDKYTSQRNFKRLCINYE